MPTVDDHLKKVQAEEAKTPEQKKADAAAADKKADADAKEAAENIKAEAQPKKK